MYQIWENINKTLDTFLQNDGASYQQLVLFSFIYACLFLIFKH